MKLIKVDEKTYKILKEIRDKLELRGFSAVIRILLRIALGEAPEFYKQVVIDTIKRHLKQKEIEEPERRG